MARLQSSPRKNAVVTKLEGHVDHLVTGYMNALAEYRLVSLMLYERDTVEHFGRGERARGFLAIRHALYRHVVQECWKLACDTDKRTPSVIRIMAGLQQPGVRDFLRDRYSRLRVPIANEVDAETRCILERLDQADDEKRSKEFDEVWQRVHDSWAAFNAEPFYEGVMVLRDKVTAHTELRLVGDRYERVNLTGKMKFGDERKFLEGLRSIVTDLNLLVRQSLFDWANFDAETHRDAQAFWAIGQTRDGP